MWYIVRQPIKKKKTKPNQHVNIEPEQGNFLLGFGYEFGFLIATQPLTGAD